MFLATVAVGNKYSQNLNGMGSKYLLSAVLDVSAHAIQKSMLEANLMSLSKWIIQQKFCPSNG